jgi:hypothetical protein
VKDKRRAEQSREYVTVFLACFQESLTYLT